MANFCHEISHSFFYLLDSFLRKCLKKLVQFIMQVHAKALSEIKQPSKFYESPHILFNAVTRLLPENFLYAIVKDGLRFQKALTCNNRYNYILLMFVAVVKT